MSDASVPPAAPPPAAKTPGKPPYMLLGIGAAVLIGLFLLFSGMGGPTPSASRAATVAYVPPATEAASATDAPAASDAANSTAAPAAQPAPGNPILGTWELVDTNMEPACEAERVFDTYEEARAHGVRQAIYVVNPTYVEVGYGGPNIEEWELHGSDDVTLRMSSPSTVGYGSGGSSGTSSTVEAQAQANCRYHRK